MDFDYDVIILGSGPAGFSCAMQASKFDKKAVVIEANPDHLGGTWINTGTVPSKALRVAAKTIYDFHKQYEDEDSPRPYERFEMQELLQYKDRILNNQNEETRRNLNKNQVKTIHGYGRIKDDHTVLVTDTNGEEQELTTEYILISTGSTPSEPEQFEVDHNKVLDSQSILNITHIPRRLVIVGSGVNAIEYATMFNALGSRVTLLNTNESFVPFLDHEIKEHLDAIFGERNIRIVNNVNVDNVSYNPLRTSTEIRFTTSDDEIKVLETDHLLYFGGRTPNTGDLGLDNTRVELNDEGYIPVDNNFKTSVENIYAAGDVVGFPALASASFSQGRLAACDMFGIPALDVPPEIPFGIYAIPEISSIGITEEQARKRDYDITIGRAYFKNNAMGDIGNKRDGILKLVFDTNSFKLLGVHIIGENACELIHLGQSVMAFGGDIRYFIRHVLNYPTFSEAYRIAAFNGVNRVYKAGVKYKKILS